ncbi:succinyldiaminopimelate transaminase [Candidatus Litorirhabdus singularis]|nr:succinyldiaminopimelate transaminase [Candidatus Litorirhabdus singularis]
MNPDLERLQSYPFERLRKLFADITPNAELAPITLGIGEPQHPAPQFVVESLQQHLPLLAKYPATRGIAELRQAIANWLQQRFSLAQVDPETQVLPVSGTREGLFAIAQCLIDRSSNPLVLAPNPFYQIYEGAALLAGADLHLLDCTSENQFSPDFSAVPAAVWQRCQMLYICTPGNPTGKVMGAADLQALIELAQRYDFVIVSDECYSEIYPDETQPPLGLLQVCEQMGLQDYRRCLVFHSLSKRSNLPGLRSGFVAGDATLLQQFLLYRTYQGCAMPMQNQWASAAAWSDETHVRHNRELYRSKFTAVCEILGDCLDYSQPEAGFYLWPQTPIDDTEFARGLLQQHNLTVLPGRYLARDSDGGLNPGSHRVRLALVAPESQCVEAAHRIKRYVESL